MNNCKACTKSFSDFVGLKAHLKRTKLCRDWMELLTNPTILPPEPKSEFVPTAALRNSTCFEIDSFDNKLVEKIQQTYESSDLIEPMVWEFQCVSCHKIFSTKSNLNKHVKRTLICQKWEKYHSIQTRQDYSKVGSYNSLKVSRKISAFEALPAIPMHHIVWNLYLTDKDSIVDYKKHKIDLVVCLMPESEFLEYSKKSQNTKFVNLEYNEHTKQSINIEEYKLIGIELTKLQEERKNTLIVCNNGYQRSLPFLCYYLVNEHNDEYPTIESVLDLVLSQLDPQNYLSLKPGYITSIKQLNLF